MIEHTFKEEPGKIVLLDKDKKQIGILTYKEAGQDVIVIDHTGVDTAYRGQGLAAELVKKAVEMAIRDNKKVVPLCPYAQEEFAKNESYKKCEYHED
jgi:uncharacterized protein